MQIISYFDTLPRAQKGYARMLEPVCKKWNLTRNELDILLFLQNNPGLDRAADIVSHRGIAKSHVSQSVGLLENKGLLLRVEDSTDRRTIRLRLTQSALPIAREGQEAQKKFFEQIRRGLSGEELALMREVIRKVCDNRAKMEE